MRTEYHDEQARRWLARLYGPELTAPERLRFETWLHEHPAHVSAFRAAEQVWRDLSLTAALGEVDIDPAPASARAHWRWISAAVAASVLILATFLGVIRPHLAVDSFVTGPNETRELTLPDGSRVKLGAGARLTVDFDSEDRRVVLKTGEAHFAVTTDRRRPFHVTAGPVLLRVLGTEFDVRLERREVRIAVSQGEVEVNRKSTSGGASSPAARPVRQILSAGHALTLSERRGERLSYENATLGEVIEGMNLYSERPIVIADEPLRGIRITAAFSADQIATALAGLAATHPIELDEQSDGRIVLRLRR